MAAPNSEHDARSCRRRAHGKADLASARPDRRGRRHRRAAGTAGPPGWRAGVHSGRTGTACGPNDSVLPPCGHLGASPTDQSTLDAAALPTIIDRIRAQGYTSVTVQGLTG
jgi:hypothetical protein